MKYIFLFIIALGTVSCTKKRDISRAIILKVNQKTLSVEEFSNQLLEKIKYFDALTIKQPDFIGQIKKTLVNEFIVRALAEDYAKKNNIFVKTEDLEKEVTKIRSGYPDDLTFQQSLAQEKITFTEWKKQILYLLLQKKIQEHLNKEVSPPSTKELKDYYDRHKKDFHLSESRKLQQIVANTKVDAEIMLKKLKKGRKIEDLVKFSITPDANNEGRLGWVEKGESPIFDQVFSLKPGQYSPIIKSEYGFHIIKVLDKQSSRQLSLNQAKKEIEKILVDQKEQNLYSKWLDEQIRKSKIYKNDNLIKTIAPEIRG